ncbi:Ig-like domain-containing protein [Dysgonomonas sp. ZJ279]|uniref:Ig-like domain-containing protein n=1 Tax=Dysgonomonas sp. ZJ279 TaxID=2709796 RepID=UPI0013EC0F26|nr:Ig-like domain-containing protein [Dysgonomonas sp. ZJ279]
MIAVLVKKLFIFVSISKQIVIMIKTYLLLLLSIFMFSACSSDDDHSGSGTITFEKDEVSILIGEKTRLTPIFDTTTKDKEYRWLSNDPNVVKVDINEDNSADITAIAEGNTIVRIEAVDGTIFAICKINVGKGSISFSNAEETINTNETLELSPIFSDEFLKTKEYEWLNSSTDVADIIVSNNNSITINAKKAGKTTIKIQSKDGTLSASCNINVIIGSVKKWVALGNSITKHSITSFWWGEWGMAATKKENDYIHVLNRSLEVRYNNDISFHAINVAAWERDFKGFNKNSLDNYLAGDEDLIIIRLGENVPSNETVYASYKDELDELVKYLKGKSPKANYIITGNFWTNKRKDAIQKEVAEKHNCIWVTLDHLDTPDNKSTLDTKVFGDDGKWHLISEGGATAPGVANHPGDKGMAGIADAILKSIQ